MPLNTFLLEATEDGNPVKTGEIVKGIRKQMNVCKLTKFRSLDSCGKFYSSFFLSTLEEDVHPTVAQWGEIYAGLLGNDPFCADLALFMIMYQPTVYQGIFMSLWNLIQSELAAMAENRIRYLSMVRGILTVMRMRMEGVGNLVKVQCHDPNVVKFLTVTDQTLRKMDTDLSALTQAELAKAVKPDDVAFVNTAYVSEGAIGEDWKDLLSVLENGMNWISNRERFYLETEPLDESIVRNAVMKAKELGIKKKKAERDFEEFVMKRVKKIREERRNRKHSEMVGEALRVNREIIRILRTGALYIIPTIGPALAAIHFIASLVYDRHTDKRDRQVLVRQLRDELEIIDEKIAMADRQGDDRARIELIRCRQKLENEYERIQHMRWDKDARARVSG